MNQLSHVSARVNEAAQYQEYCRALAYLQAPDNFVQAFSFSAPIVKFIATAKETLGEIASIAKVGFTELLNAFKSKDVFQILKAVGFNVVSLLKIVHKGVSIVTTGFMAVIEEIAESKILKDLASGAKKVDDFLDKYPILKKLAGATLAGFLLWAWLNSVCLGDPKFDFDLTLVLGALKGKIGISHMLGTPAGIAALTALSVGLMSGGAIGAQWLGSSTANLLLALSYAGAHKIKDSKLAAHLKNVLHLHMKKYAKAKLTIEDKLARLKARRQGLPEKE